MHRAGVIGLGDIAQIHVPLLQRMEHVELVAVCDIDEQKKDEVKNAAFYTSYEEMIEKEDLDVVHICLPHYLHYPVSKYCAEHGLHVLQEKPLALSYQEACAAAVLEANTSTKLCLCLQNRMNASFQKMQEMIRSGMYGTITGIKGIVAWARPKGYYTIKPWRGTWEFAGGGVMINQSIHTLDLMQMIGGEITSIKGSVSNLLDYDIEVEDTATAAIQFASGVRGWFVATNANSDNDSVVVEVHLEKAILTIQDSKLYIKEGNGDAQEIVEDAVLDGPKSYYGAGHSIVFEDFYQAIEQDNEAYIHLREGVASMKMIDAIQRSSKLNRTVKMEELDHE